MESKHVEENGKHYIVYNEGTELIGKVQVSYIDPSDYGCKPGVLTWQYLNALWDQAFPKGG